MLKQLKNGIIHGFGFLLIIGFAGVSYAAWNSLSTESPNDLLTADKWNKMVDNINFNNNSVAFNVKLNSHKTYNNLNKVIWDTATVNEGNAYNISTNIFTAPYNGIYMFNIISGTYLGSQSQISLYRNGTILSYGRSYNDGGDRNSSNSIIIELNAGDTIETYYSGYSSSSGKLNSLISGFNGYLLFRK